MDFVNEHSLIFGGKYVMISASLEDFIIATGMSCHSLGKVWETFVEVAEDRLVSLDIESIQLRLCCYH